MQNLWSKTPPIGWQCCAPAPSNTDQCVSYPRWSPEAGGAHWHPPISWQPLFSYLAYEPLPDAAKERLKILIESYDAAADLEENSCRKDRLESYMQALSDVGLMSCNHPLRILVSKSIHA